MSDNDYTPGKVGQYSTAGFTADGWKIFVTVNIMTHDNPGEAFKRLQAEVQAAGLQLNPAGIDDGQQIETVHFVCKRTKYNDDGTETPVIGMYTDWGEWKWNHEYLNTLDDIQAFESAAQVKVNALPAWVGDSFPQRNSGNKKADAHIVQVVPFRVVREAKGEGQLPNGQTYTKWKLVRYEPLVTNGSAPEAPAQPKAKASVGSTAAQPYDFQVVMKSSQLEKFNKKHLANILKKHESEFEGMTNQEVVDTVKQNHDTEETIPF